MTDAEKLQYLFDRAQISDVVSKFAVCLDTRNWPEFRNCFAETVEFDFPLVGGYRKVSRDSLLVSTPKFFERLAATQHVSANHQIEITGDKAVCISTLLAQHFLPGHPGGDLQRQVGYYRNVLRREGEAWRICRVEQHVSWMDGNQDVFDYAAAGRSDLKSA